MRKIEKKKFLMASAAACLALCAGGALNSVAADAADANLVMKTGASLYLDEVSGLKFAYTVNNYDASANKNYGMLIVPFDYLEKADISLTDSDEEDYVALLQAAKETGAIPFAPIVEENLQPKQVDGEWLVENAVTTINEQNYVREWFGIGFEKTGENSYVYATSDDNVRSVFEVANLAQNKIYTNAFDESDAAQLAEKNKLIANDTLLDSYITKGFDFVYDAASALSYNGTYVGNDENGAISLNLTKAEGKESIDLTSQLHWTTAVDAEAVATVSKETWAVTPVAFGETKFTATLGGAKTLEVEVPVYTDETQYLLAQNARADSGETEWVKYNADGSVSVRSDGYTDGYITKLKTHTQGYVGFNGTCGVNQFVDVEFTGNNMPIVRLLADEINGRVAFGLPAAETDGETTASKIARMDRTGLKGAFFYNGSDSDKTTTLAGRNACYVGETLLIGNMTNTTASNGITGYGSGAPSFTMQSLIDNSTTKYKLTVGTIKDRKNNVIFHAVLSNEVEDEWVRLGELARPLTTLGLTYEDNNIVFMSAFKEEGEYTTFKCSQPYAVATEEVAHLAEWTKTGDGSYDVKMKTVSANTNSWVNAEFNNSGFFALNGSYGIGTYVDVEFTGRYIPVVRLTAQDVNAKIGETSSGALFHGGVYGASAQKDSHIFTGNVTSGGAAADDNCSKRQYIGSLFAMIGNAKFENTKFKFTLGTTLDSDGTVLVDWRLQVYDETNSKWQYVTAMNTTTVEFTLSDSEPTDLTAHSFRYDTNVSQENSYKTGAIIIKPRMVKSGGGQEVNYKITVYNEVSE